MSGKPLSETRIQVGGVLRCCLATVAQEYEGELVSDGMASRCVHCGEEFRLVGGVWKPLWVLEMEA